MTDENVRWLLIGAGAIATKRLAAALAASSPGGLVGVCDIAEDAARSVAQEYGASEVYTEVDDALSKTTANAVYVATPVYLHVPHAMKAIKAGKHVLVEKPLGLDASDAARLIAATEEADVRTACAYYRRCYPCYQQAQQMIADGEFGRIVLVRMTYFSWCGLTEDNWRVVKSKSGGGPLSDMGSHMFDVLIGLLGMPRTVTAKVNTLVQSYEVEDAAAMIMEMPDGAYVTASFNWNSRTWSHEFEIIGTEAKVKWHPYDSGKVLKTVGRDIQELDLPNAANPHLPLVQDFVEAVRAGREPIVPLAEAARTNVLLDAVYRSAETGQEIEL